MAEGRHRRADCGEDHAEGETCLPASEWYEEAKNQPKPGWTKVDVFLTGFGLTQEKFHERFPEIQRAKSRIMSAEEASKSRIHPGKSHAKAFIDLLPIFRRAPKEWSYDAANQMMLQYHTPMYQRRLERMDGWRRRKQQSSDRNEPETSSDLPLTSENLVEGIQEVGSTAVDAGRHEFHNGSHQLNDPTDERLANMRERYSSSPDTMPSPEFAFMPPNPGEGDSYEVRRPTRRHSFWVFDRQHHNIEAGRNNHNVFEKQHPHRIVPNMVPQHQIPHLGNNMMELKKHFILVRRHRQTYMSLESVSQDGKLSWDLLCKELRTIFGAEFHEIALLDGRERVHHRFSHLAASQATLSSVMEMEPFKTALSVHLSPVDMMGELLDDTGDIKV